MSETNLPTHYGHSDRDRATETVLDQMRSQSRGGPGVEQPTAAMFEAILAVNELRPLLSEAADRSLNTRGIKSPAAVSAIRGSFIDYFRARYTEQGTVFRDAERLTASDWDEPVSLLKNDIRTEESMATFALYAGLQFREPATPRKERYFGPELIAQVCADRFTNGIRALDIGCSILVGAQQLMYKDEFPMEFKRVAETRGPNTSGKDVTEKVNTLLRKSSLFKSVVGVDIFPVYDEQRQVYDEGNAQFALSCLRPSERNDAEYLGIVEALMNKKQKKPDNLHYDADSTVYFQQANLLNPADQDRFKKRFPELFDMIILNYITQELSEQDQIKMHDTAMKLLSKNGILIYNHQAYLHPWNIPQPAPIRSVKHYSDYATNAFRSNMHLVDNLAPVTGIQEMMSYYDNSCQIARIGSGRLAVNGSFERLDDLIATS